MSGLLPEVNDESVSDEDLGKIVRAYRGMVRPPEVHVVEPGWVLKMTVLLVVALGGMLSVGGVAFMQGINKSHEQNEMQIVLLCAHMSTMQPNFPDHATEKKVEDLCRGH